MLQHFRVVIRELQPMPCKVTYISLIAAVITIIKCRYFTKAYISSRIVLIEITIFFNEYNLRTYISMRRNILIL